MRNVSAAVMKYVRDEEKSSNLHMHTYIHICTVHMHSREARNLSHLHTAMFYITLCAIISHHLSSTITSLFCINSL